METSRFDTSRRRNTWASLSLKVKCLSGVLFCALSVNASSADERVSRLANVVKGPCGFKVFGNFSKTKALEDGSVLLTRMKTSEDPGPRVAADNKPLARALVMKPGEIEQVRIQAHASEILDSELVELDRLCGTPDGILAAAKKRVDEYRMRTVIAQLAKSSPDLAVFSGAFPPAKPPVLSSEEQTALDQLNQSVAAQAALKRMAINVPRNISRAISTLNIERGYDIPFGEVPRESAPAN